MISPYFRYGLLLDGSGELWNWGQSRLFFEKRWNWGQSRLFFEKRGIILSYHVLLALMSGMRYIM